MRLCFQGLGDELLNGPHPCRFRPCRGLSLDERGVNPAEVAAVIVTRRWRGDHHAPERLGGSEEPRRPLRLLLTAVDGCQALETLRDALLVAQLPPDRQAFCIQRERCSPTALV